MFLYFLLFAVTFLLSLFFKPVFILIPLFTLAMILFVVIFYLAAILTAIFIGRLIAVRLTGKTECSPGRSLLIGLIVLVPGTALPYVGMLIFLVASLLGFGTLSVAAIRLIRQH